jgi:hypothetical protein
MEEYQEGILEDYIMSRSAGMLITTTWAQNYGDAFNNISKIQTYFEEQKETESFMISKPNGAEKADSVIISDSTGLIFGSGKFFVFKDHLPLFPFSLPCR